MSRNPLLVGFFTLWAMVALTGCHPQQPFYAHEDGDLSHYLDVATDIEYPDVQEQSLDEVNGAMRPFSLENSTPKEMWDLTLEEAVRNALANAKILKVPGSELGGNSPFNQAPDTLLRSPGAAVTIYDPAIVETNPRGGIEAALSAFDAQLSSSVTWEKMDTPRNTFAGFTSIFPTVNREDTGAFQAQISKTAATGGTWALRHNVNYDLQKDVARIFPSDWNVNLEAEMRHPLLQGAGVQFNRISGPGAIPGFNNGVMIARLNTDIALGDVEKFVHALVGNVERNYWELYFKYRNLDAVIAGRDAGLRTWREVKTKMEVGAKGGDAHEESQARAQYFLFVATVEQSLNELYATERYLRYQMGLASTDGRLIRPADEPTTAKVTFDWSETLTEGLCRRPALRQQKWEVKRRELELISAKNYLLPRLDAVARYRWLGLGDTLLRSDDTGLPPFDNAYGSMTGGNFQEWSFGLELNVPIGFRKEMAGVRNAQLSLARERARLQDMELEVSHQLAFSISSMEDNLKQAETNFNRRVAAKDEVDAALAKYEVGVADWTLSQVLDAQRRLAQAESEYYRVLVAYNVAIMDVHFRKGSLLEYNGVQLAEGPWPGKAYFDANTRARARDAGTYLDYGFTQPKVISRGPYQQQAGGGLMPIEGEMIETGQPTEAPPEAIPAPLPEAAASPAPPVPVPVPVPGQQAGQQAGELQLEGPANSTGWSPIQTVGHEAAVEPSSSKWASSKSASSKSTGSKWTAAKTSNSLDTWHESVATPTTVATDRPAAGWKGIQR